METDPGSVQTMLLASVPQVPRVGVDALTQQRFLDDYVLLNRPVIVTDAIRSWDIESRWTPAALARRFGAETVQVYNNYFDLQTLMPLSKYLAQHFDKACARGSRAMPYVRWYTQLRDAPFSWADRVFAQLHADWRLPAFVPEDGYVLPLALGDMKKNPVRDAFPAKGLFISPRGARTGLHVDPWASCAILCQLYGSKRWYLYEPAQARYLRNQSGVVDVTRPDYEKFPAFAKAQLTMTCVLKPGEVIYVPHGWHHQVECDSDAISLTWNFVHRLTAHSLLAWLQEAHLSEFDLSVLRYFYSLPAGTNTVERVLTLIRNQLEQTPVGARL